VLFMKIVSIDPDKKLECTRERAGAGVPELSGVKMLGEWSTLDSSRVFVPLDVTDPRDLARMLDPYKHLVRDEIFPVIETEELIKLRETWKK